jgi:murein DD-endopeptidase MepM/ murein hydrolase activator NlpD
MRIHPISKERVLHRGVDIKAPDGTSVVATADGTVEISGYDDRYGNHIIIRHDSLYQSLYAHLAEIRIKTGQAVKAGAEIGTVGNTGQSTAPHLHYEVIRAGEYEDPKDYLGLKE